MVGGDDGVGKCRLGVFEPFDLDAVEQAEHDAHQPLQQGAPQDPGRDEPHHQRGEAAQGEDLVHGHAAADQRPDDAGAGDHRDRVDDVVAGDDP